MGLVIPRHFQSNRFDRCVALVDWHGVFEFAERDKLLFQFVATGC
jgi:hypothetical protein